MKIIVKFIILTPFVFISCSNNNYSGIYKGNFSNNKDSLFLLKGGMYKRVLYNKNDKFLMEQEGTWKIVNSDGENIALSNFYVNENEENPLPYYEYETVQLPIETTLFATRLIVNYDFNRYYEKVK